MARTIITTAPPAYDYEWTVLSTHEVARSEKALHRIYREVELDDIDNGFYADYQEARYRSAMYPVMTPTEFEDLRTNYPQLL